MKGILDTDGRTFQLDEAFHFQALYNIFQSFL